VIAGATEVMGGAFGDTLAAVSAPVLVLVAWEPGMGVPRAELEARYDAQYARAGDARVAVIDDSRHFLMHDRPEAFLAALTAFLEEGAR
jgi:pimeloyl-ACP methyl ester carboxylesterase